MRSIVGIPAMKRYFLATRPLFLPVSICPTILGTAWGVRTSGELDAVVFALAIAAISFFHASANVLNDVYDDLSGTDARNVSYIHPFTGGSRFIQDGVLDRRTMLRLGLLMLAVSIIFGTTLAALKGVIVIVLGLIGMGLGLAYSVTPFQLSARGLGELTKSLFALP